MSAWAGYQAAEASLPALAPAALERLPPRQRQVLLAMAALDVGERAGVLAAAGAARAAGETDIAWLLELLAAKEPPLGGKAQRPALRELPGAGAVPEILLALQTWRSGGKPRGTASLRRLAATRPAIASLLDILGKKQRASWDGLANLSPRARSVLAAAYASVHALGPDLAETVRGLLPNGPLDLTRYRDAPNLLEHLPALNRWITDPRVVWGIAETMAIAPLGLRRSDRVAPVLRELVLAVHRRLTAGQGHGLLAPIRACCALARVVAPTMVTHLEVLERRLGGLLDPVRHLPSLLTLWRRSTTWPQRERLTIATRVMDVVARHLEDDADPPEGASFVVEVLAFLVVHAEAPELRVGLLEEFGWLLPEPKFNELLAPVDPASRSYLLALRGFASESLEAPLAAVIQLANRPGADRLTSKLLMRLLRDLPDEPRIPRVLRQLERTLASLVAKPQLHLDRELLPVLLESTRELGAGVEAARAVVLRELERPVADGDVEVAEHFIARNLLGDTAGAQELVRRLGRWLRHADADAADDLALGMLARVYDRLDADVDADALQLVAPLSSFVLRDGPSRPLQAALRAKAASSRWVRGLGTWAREHIVRLGPAPLWLALIEIAEDIEDFDDDDLDDREENREIPY